MVYIPRNPYTPDVEKKYTPAELLNKKLHFNIWNHEHPVNHQLTCQDADHLQLQSNGFCCIDFLCRCIESHLFDLACCRAGLFIEPPGFNITYKLFEARLAELSEGVDDHVKWNWLLDILDEEMYAWMSDVSSDTDSRPGFSLAKYKRQCLIYYVQPDLQLVASAFGSTQQAIQFFWSKRD